MFVKTRGRKTCYKVYPTEAKNEVVILVRAYALQVLITTLEGSYISFQISRPAYLLRVSKTDEFQQAYEPKRTEIRHGGKVRADS